MRPALLCIDTAARRVRRYWPKPDGGLLVDEGTLCAPEDQDATLPGILEQFRIDGGRPRKVSVPM